ncbi:MAG: L-rhamnose/proton symporter RhaT [Isosphaeraceae bacterium]
MAIGILLAVLSGTLFGICFTPMRYVKAFAWENAWFAWNFWACLVLTPLIAWLTIPSAFEVFREIGLQQGLIMLGVGLLSGSSGVLFGLGLARVGTTLVNALCNGISLIAGSFIPLIVQHREALEGRIGASLIAGSVLSVIGVAVCAWAGSLREEPSAYMSRHSNDRHTHRRIALEGIALSVAAGLLMPLVNLGLAFGDGLMQVARDHGGSEVFVSFAVYVPFFAGTFVSTALYCGSVWTKNRSYLQFVGPRGLHCMAFTCLIAALWMGGNTLYGWALPWMQSYGPVLAWPICLASCNIAAALVECAYGDWQGRALYGLAAGLGILTASIATFGCASLLIQQAATSP